jgi:hypothetical protein
LSKFEFETRCPYLEWEFCVSKCALQSRLTNGIPYLFAFNLVERVTPPLTGNKRSLVFAPEIIHEHVGKLISLSCRFGLHITQLNGKNIDGW